MNKILKTIMWASLILFALCSVNFLFSQTHPIFALDCAITFLAIAVGLWLIGRVYGRQPDYKGYVLHYEEAKRRGFPIDRGYLLELERRYHIDHIYDVPVANHPCYNCEPGVTWAGCSVNCTYKHPELLEEGSRGNR